MNQIDNKKMELLMTKAQNLMSSSLLEEALKILNEILIIDSKYILALLYKGNALNDLCRYQEALGVFDEILEIGPDLVFFISEALRGKGYALDKLGRYQEAMDVVEKVLKINPEDESIALFKSHLNNCLINEQVNTNGMITLSKDEYFKMLEDGDICLDESQVVMDGPLEMNRLKRKARNLFLLEKNSEALEVFNKILEIEPQNVNILNDKGCSLLGLIKNQEALDVFDKILIIDPNDMHGLSNKGISLSRLGKHQEGLEFIDEALIIYPNNANILNEKGVTLMSLRRYQEALKVFEEAIKNDPKNIYAIKNRDATLSNLNKLQETSILKQNETNKYYLFFDTETTGLPRNYNAPTSDLNNWPRLVQVAWILCDKEGNYLEERSYIIKPEGFRIPIDASSVHGITTEIAERDGVSLESVLIEFQDMIAQADFLVAHNMSFDEKIVGAEFIRKNISNSIHSTKKICTKERSTNFCAIPSSNGFSDYKWPKLSELHYRLFGEMFEGAHDALSDIRATAKCFWELKRKGIL